MKKSLFSIALLAMAFVLSASSVRATLVSSETDPASTFATLSDPGTTVNSGNFDFIHGGGSSTLTLTSPVNYKVVAKTFLKGNEFSTEGQPYVFVIDNSKPEATPAASAVPEPTVAVGLVALILCAVYFVLRRKLLFEEEY